MLFRWYIGLAMVDAVWVTTVFTKHLERLIKHDAVIKFFSEVEAIAQGKDLLCGEYCSEHCSVDGTLIQAWVGCESYAAKDDDPANDDGGNFKGERRSKEPHESETGPCARLYRKGNTASELRVMGHTLSDHRHGSIASAVVTPAEGYAECEAARGLICEARQALVNSGCEVTLGAYKDHDVSAPTEI